MYTLTKTKPATEISICTIRFSQHCHLGSVSIHLNIYTVNCNRIAIYTCINFNIYYYDSVLTRWDWLVVSDNQICTKHDYCIQTIRLGRDHFQHADTDPERRKQFLVLRISARVSQINHSYSLCTCTY